MNYHKNVKLLKFSNSFGFAALFVLPIYLPYYLSKGITLTEFFYIASFSSVVSIILETPSGYLSDVWNRKYTLILGRIFQSIGWCVLMLAKDFSGLMLSSILRVIGGVLCSGTNHALLYDSLESQKKEKDFSKLIGAEYQYNFLALGFASFLGGFLYTINKDLPAILNTISYTVSAFLCLNLVEPERKTIIKENYFKKYVEIFKHCFLDRKDLRYILIFASSFNAFAQLILWFFQGYLEYLKVPYAWFGIIFVSDYIIRSFSSKKSSLILSKNGIFNSYLLVVFLLFIGFSFPALYFTVFAIVFFYIASVARGISLPLSRAVINDRILSENRATIMSIGSMIYGLVYALCCPIQGALTESYGLRFGMLGIALLFLIFQLFMLIKVKENIKL